MITKLLVIVSAAFLGMFSACGLLLLQGGVATVYVQEDDFWLFVPVPINAVEMALSFVPPQELNEMRHELEKVKDLVPAVLDELANCPDAVFVEVESDSEKVVVEKSDGTLIVRVKSSDHTAVKVKIPIRGVKRVVERVADI